MFRLLAGWTIVAVLLAPRIFAQVNLSAVAGIVEDTSGARISSASIKLINTLTGNEIDNTTDRDGSFWITGVEPGNYTLQIERAGFAAAQIIGLTVTEGDTKRLLIRLRMGSVTETVEIDASSVTVSAAEAPLTTLFGRKFVASVPVNGRSFQDLITMTPGVLTQTPQAAAGPSGTGGSLSVNGQKTNANVFLVDGISGNFGAAELNSSRKAPSDGSQPALTALGTTQTLASVDALDEFRIMGSGYSAEYGTAPGGQFALTTRSGFDAGAHGVHGSLYNYRRFAPSDSIDWFEGFYLGSGIQGSLDFSNNGEYVGYQQNDFGGSIGLPLALVQPRGVVGRSFVFASFEALRVSQPSPYRIYYSPSNAIYKQVPNTLQTILYDFPYTVGYESATQVPLIPATGLSKLPARLSADALRVDSRLSASTTAFVRYARSPSDNEGVSLASLASLHDSASAVTLGITTQLSQTRANEFRLGYAGSRATSSTGLTYTPYGNLAKPHDLLDGLGVPTPHPMDRGEVYIHINGYGESSIFVDQASSSLRQWNVRDVLSNQIGRHFLRLGTDYRHIASGVAPAPLSVEADFFDTDALINNAASAVSITKTTPATALITEFGAFAQDEWKVSKRLAVSAGLRWEVDPPPHGKSGADGYTTTGSLADPASVQLAQRGTPLWHTSWINVAPRLSAAWAVGDHSGKETVVRAGVGVYFDSDNQGAAQSFSAIGFSATNYLTGVPVPLASTQFDFTVTPSAPYTDALVFAFPRHFQLPYTFEWNVSLDQALGRNQLLNASWIGASGHRLLDERRVNINVQNPLFGEIAYFPAGVTSNYQSLQLKFQRRMSTGTQALASYVWSRTLDYGSTAPQFPLVYGNSDLDVRHNLQAVVSWQQHTHVNHWLLRAVFGNWAADGRLSVRTGFPVNLMGNLFSDPTTGERYYSAVNRISERPLYRYGAQYPGGRAFNGGPDASDSAFALPPVSDPGNAPRNMVRDFSYSQINAALAKDFHFTRRINLHLRAEAFNLFNHQGFGFIDPVLGNQLFGQATLLLNQSLGTDGPLFQPGGPRSIQFSTKIQF
ncbi:MAG: TonB-dependent receptor [Terracidiphilus sp.]|nr:TonB-dependent receptor [Terracidiphilus sp.]